MRTVLFFLESLKGGGAEKVLLDLIKSLGPTEYKIKILVVTNNGIYDDEIKEYCEYESILDTNQLNGKIYDRLIYKLKYKLIYKLPTSYIYNRYIGNEWDTVVAFVEGFPTKVISNADDHINSVAWVHVDPLERDYADKYYKTLDEQKETYMKFNKIICVSDSVKKSFIKKWNIKSTLVTLYNPILTDEIKLKASENLEMRKKWKIQFIAVGRLVSQKGFDRLIKAVNKLRNDNYSDFGLIILGEGEEHEYLDNLIQKYELNQIVKILGFKNNPYPYMATSDILVCSSRAEGYSLVVAEAMVLGLGILSTNCSGPNELLDYGEFGLLVENDENGIFDGLKEILENRELLLQLKDKAKERSKWFDNEKFIQQLKHIL